LRDLSIDSSYRIRLNAVVPNDALKKLRPILNSDDVLLDTPATSKAIASIRESFNISQKALAIEMGISQAYLCDLEHAKRRWSLKLFDLAKSSMEKLI